MKILIDNGHGENTPGKRSPDGRFREYAWTREIAAAVVQTLNNRGYTAMLLVPETYDVSLAERVRRANAKCDEFKTRNVCLVSIHVNAAGMGDKWMDARGFSCYTSRGQTAGDRLADSLYQAAELYLPGHKIRRDYTDGDPDLEADFTILKNTQCAAALVECLFQDNKQDVEFLESYIGKQTFISLIVQGIVNYCRP